MKMSIRSYHTVGDQSTGNLYNEKWAKVDSINNILIYTDPPGESAIENIKGILPFYKTGEDLNVIEFDNIDTAFITEIGDRYKNG